MKLRKPLHTPSKVHHKPSYIICEVHANTCTSLMYDYCSSSLFEVVILLGK